MSSILNEDYINILKSDFIDWEIFRNSTIFVTGATGLIGSSLIRSLDYVNKELHLNISIIALVRNEENANEKFKDILSNKHLSFIEGTVEALPCINQQIDYIVHGASQTASKEFVQHAVETINTSILGTTNILKLAMDKKVKGFVYLSSMEVYGYPEKGHKVSENEMGALTSLDLRNSYPISKIMSESICCAYASEYGIPAKICRLTQTFGPGVNYNDQRIFAYFARCVIEKQNIVLKTKGLTERCYLYIADAITAILTLLVKGGPGKAYNAADEKTYCSISEMADVIAKEGGISVEYDIQDEKKYGFAKTLYMDLNTDELKMLGWKTSNYSIQEIYLRMINYLLNNQ